LTSQFIVFTYKKSPLSLKKKREETTYYGGLYAIKQRYLPFWCVRQPTLHRPLAVGVVLVGMVYRSDSPYKDVEKDM